MAGRDVTEFERLLGLLTHDLREPVRAVTGFADLLEREAEGALSDRGMEFLALIRQAGERMEDLLDGLAELDRAGRTPPAPAPVDLGEALEAVLDRRAASIRARHAQVTRDPLPVVNADAAAVQKLIDQLVDNALKFTDRAQPHVHVEAAAGSGGWQLTVADDGIGIPERERARVFEMFRRLHPRDAYPGNGVGLAVCERVVQRRGGRMWIDDGLEGGSAVHVLMPERAA